VSERFHSAHQSSTDTREVPETPAKWPLLDAEHATLAQVMCVYDTVLEVSDE
jgi:hypothetical protein